MEESDEDSQLLMGSQYKVEANSSRKSPFVDFVFDQT